MKNILLLLFLLPLTILAQNADQYNYSTSAGTYTEISGTVGTISGGTPPDDGYIPSIPIGFTFNFCGTAYTTVGATTNGWMGFGTVTASGFSNNIGAAADAPLVAALWDDDNITGGDIQYLTTGTAPNRTFTLQWKNLHCGGGGSSSNPTINMQVILTETANTINIVYGSSSAAASSLSASIGITNISGKFYCISNVAANTASNITAQNSLSAFPANGRTYTFSPPLPCSGTPSAGTISGPATSGCSSFVISNTGATTGIGMNFAWQSSTAAGGPWTNINGQNIPTSATVFPLAPISYYRFVDTCTISGFSAISNTIQVTADIPSAGTISGPATSGCASFVVNNTGAATGTGMHYAWQSSTSAGGPWTNINGQNIAASATVLPVAPTSFYRFVDTCTYSGISAISNTIQVTADIPSAGTISGPATVGCTSFTISNAGAASGSGMHYAWQSSSSAGGPWSNIFGQTNPASATISQLVTTYYRFVDTCSYSSLSAISNTLLVTSTGPCVLAGGTYHVGTAQPVYKKLTDVSTALNYNALTGNVIFLLDADYDGTTGEIFPVTFNQFATSGGNWNVTIRPDAGVNSITSGTNAQIILNGADRITFDGRAGGTGTAKNWILRNTVKQFDDTLFTLQNDACNNTLTYLQLEASSSITGSYTSYAIVFAGTNGTTGNDDNTISYCDIRDRSDVAGIGMEKGIFSSGNPASISLYNSGNIINGNNIFNIRRSSSSSGIWGVYLKAANDNWLINGNSFYSTAPENNLIDFHCIDIAQFSTQSNPASFIISNNFIGGSGPNCSGGPFTALITSTSAITTGVTFHIIRGFRVADNGYTSFTVTNNTIQNLSLTGSSPSTYQLYFIAVNSTRGTNIINGNTIGSATVPSSVAVTYIQPSSHETDIVLINHTGGGSIVNNSIAGVEILPTYPSAGPGVSEEDYHFISHQKSVNDAIADSAINLTIAGNIIGSNTMANSINIRTQQFVTFTPNNPAALINAAMGPASTVNITNNTVNNVTFTSTSSVEIMRGIKVSGTGNVTVGQNSIRNVSVLGTTNPNSVLKTRQLVGIDIISGSNALVYRNTISNLLDSSTDRNSSITGINLQVPATVSNNMISLTNGNPAVVNLKSPTITGILDSSKGGTSNYYYNTVFVGGQMRPDSLQSSYTFRRHAAGTSAMYLRNNLFFNDRTGGTGTHWSVSNEAATPATGWPSTASDYNLFVANDVSKLGQWGVGTNQTFAQWKTSSQGDSSSYAMGAAGLLSASLFNNATNGDLTINNANAENWYVNGKAITGSASANIADDNGAALVRSTTAGTPADIGADEFNANAGVLPPLAIPSSSPALNSTTTYSFAGRRVADIVWGSGGTVPSNVDLRYYSGIQPPGYTAPRHNSYFDMPATGGSGYSYNMKLYYTDAENNALANSGLGMIKQDGANPWGWQSGTFGTDANGKFLLSTGYNSFSKFGISQQAGGLPVTLIYFTGYQQNNDALLSWKTTDAVNFSHFEIERSLNGIVFVSIGQKQAINSPGEIKYDYADVNAAINFSNNGKIFYRLKMVDRDGRFKYSQVIRINPGKQQQLLVYPNPASNEVMVQGNQTILNLQLFDMAGKMVKQFAPAVDNRYNISDITAGVYMLRINSNDGPQIIKLVKQ